MGLITVNVKLFATLRRYIPDYDPDKGIDVVLNEGSSLKGLIHALCLSRNEARVIIVNGMPRKMTDLINNGDQVSIFTPIIGG